jgi:hypothetical protein
MIISIDSEKASNKIQHPFQETRNRGKVPDMIKALYAKGVDSPLSYSV